MNKKKITTMVTAVALCTMIAIGGTLAWFTDKGEVTNVVTFGNVDIKLEETKNGALQEGGLTFDNVVPGDELAKDPTITNISENQCYIRAKVTFTGDSIIDGTALNIDSTKWKLANDGYYYYKDSLAKNGSAQLFTTVTIPTTLGNSAAGKTFDIKVEAEAIQKDNFKFDWNSETPWGTTPITAETYPVPVP